MVWCKAHFDILHRFGRESRCDGLSDVDVANAALNGVARTKTT